MASHILGKYYRRATAAASSLVIGFVLATAAQQDVALAESAQVQPPSRWQIVNGMKAVDLALASDETLYVLSMEKTARTGAYYVYKRIRNHKDWIRMSGDVLASKIAVQGVVPWIIDGGGYVQFFNGKGWTKVSSPRAKGIAANAGGVSIIDADLAVHTRKGNKWIKVRSPRASRIDIDATGNLWVAAPDGQFFVRNGNKWAIKGDTRSARDIAVDDPERPMTVMWDGNVQKYYPQWKQWLQESRDSSVVAVATRSGRTWVVARNGTVFWQVH